MLVCTCEVCGKEFKPSKGQPAKYCSASHANKASELRSAARAAAALAAERGEAPPPEPGTDAFYLQDLSTAPAKMWKKLLDEKQYPDREFLNLFLISTEEVGPDGVVRPKPFIYRPVQEELHALQDSMDKAGFTEIRIPKSRKHGISRQTMSRYGFARVLRRSGYVTIIVAQDNDMAMEHFERLNELFGQVNWTALKDMKIEMVESTRRSISIMHENGFRSTVRVRTANKRGLGRGGTPNAILLTERGNAWTAEAHRALPGLLQSQRRARGNALIDESTAGPEGNSFHRDCKSAQAERGIAKLLFFPAYRHPLNYKPFATAAQREAFVGRLGDVYYGEAGEEENARALALAYWTGKSTRETPPVVLDAEAAETKALEFLHWRREDLDSTCQGSVETLHRDHPLTLDEAFHGTGRPVFDHRILRTYTQAAEEKQRSGETGRLVEKESGVVFEPMPGGPLLVYRRPALGENRHESFCFGMDVASGRDRQSGSGHSADWTVINVDDVYTGVTVAKFRDHVVTTEAARTLVLLARWYADGAGVVAKGFVELGGGWGDAIVATVKEMDDGEWLDCLLMSKASEEARVKWRQEDVYGYKVSRQAMALLAARGQEFINSELKARKAIDSREGPFDRDTLDEMKAYSYDEHGKMEASSGHDDCCVAKLLTLHARVTLFSLGEVAVVTDVPKEKTEDWLVSELKRQWTKDKGGRRDAVLGRRF